MKERKFEKPQQHFEDNPWQRESKSPFVQIHSQNGQMDLDKPEPKPEPYGLIPRWFMEGTLGGYGRRTCVADVVNLAEYYPF